MRRTPLLILMTVAWPLPGLWAQGGSDRCGITGDDAHTSLEQLAHYFVDPADSDLREDLFDQVEPSAPMAVVRDRRVCAAVYRATVQHLRTTHTNWRQLQQAGFTHTILRYGPYYAVLVDEIPPPGKTYLGWTEMLIFRVEDLSYVGTLMV